jgi:nicotinamidase-related amidase
VYTTATASDEEDAMSEAASEDEVVRALIGRLVPADLAGGRNALAVIDLQVLDAAGDGEHAQRAREQGRWEDVAAYFERVAELVSPNVNRIAAALRARSEPVIYVRCRSLTPDARDNGRRFRDFGIAVGSDDPQAAILPELEVVPGDFVLDKTTASPFWSTTLERLLAQLDVDNLLVTGVVTSGCVESTIRDACDLDYRVVLVEDACADRQPDLHADAVRRLNNNFAVAMPTAAVLGAVGAAALERSAT